MKRMKLDEDMENLWEKESKRKRGRQKPITMIL
jgi:hypothetical protein